MTESNGGVVKEEGSRLSLTKAQTLTIQGLLILVVLSLSGLFISRANILHRDPTETIQKSINSESSLQPTDESSNLIQLEPIVINPNSTMANDFESINHVPSESAIYVRFKPEARCPRPKLRGRLSGRLLVMLDWTWNNNVVNSTGVLKGVYTVPVPGRYFVEIIAELCSDWSTGIKGDWKLDDYNFTSVCLEDPSNHRVTEERSLINVISVSSWSAKPGYWVGTHFEPMRTRTQGKHCPRNTTRPNRQLMGPANTASPQACVTRDQYLHYYFQWSDLIPPIQPQPQRETTRMCVLGDSHARKLVASMQRIGITPEALNITVVPAVKARWAEVVTEMVKRNMIQNQQCKKVLIGVGQWDASWARGIPTSLGQYYRRVREMLWILHDELPTHIEIFIQSVHYGPIGNAAGSCPPVDWRSPTVIDGYNFAIQKALRELAGSQQQSNRTSPITFIDTNFIVAPMWDSADDWCHLDPQVSDVEAHYIAAVVMGVI